MQVHNTLQGMKLFVAGTGTDIGKTFVACGLLRAWGGRVRALKPVASGFEPAQAADSDAGRLLAALGEAVTPAAVARIAPWVFRAPLSPDQAAAREGRAIDFDALLAFCRRQEGPVLVEGVGGVMVPLTARETTLDWMQQLGWPVLLVTGAYLGTLSHTLTALDALAHRGVRVAAVVVNAHSEGHVPIEDTIASLRRFVGSPIIGVPATPFDALAALLTEATAPSG